MRNLIYYSKTLSTTTIPCSLTIHQNMTGRNQIAFKKSQMNPSLQFSSHKELLYKIRNSNKFIRRRGQQQRPRYSQSVRFFPITKKRKNLRIIALVRRNKILSLILKNLSKNSRINSPLLIGQLYNKYHQTISQIPNLLDGSHRMSRIENQPLNKSTIFDWTYLWLWSFFFTLNS